MARRKVSPIVQSLWIPMRDGVRIAIDVIRPADPAPPGDGPPFDAAPSDGPPRVPAVMSMTRYWRSFRLRVPQSPGSVPISPNTPLHTALLDRGIAVVAVDGRGTGASEGAWPHPWSVDEVADHREIVDWIVAQPWSNGRVAATGISYEGTTAMLLAASGHRAVVAVAPGSFEFDAFADIAFPGGVLDRSFMSAWSESASLLDEDRSPPLFGTVGRLLVAGARPVDEDRRRVELTKIVAARANPSVFDSVARIRFADDPYGGQDVSLTDLSVRSYLPALREHAVPAQVWGSWMDGATADMALRLFAELPSVREARIGAWIHTGEKHASPFAEGAAPNPTAHDRRVQIIEFLEGPLRGEPQPGHEKLIHYFTMGEERWHSTPTWPPATARPTTSYLGAEGALLAERPVTVATERVMLDPRASTGTGNRWFTELARPVRYGDRARADTRMTVWTGAALAEPLTLTGHPVVRLHVRSAGEDPVVFVYLEAVDPRGRVSYLTEGILRLIHRTPPGAESGPTFRRADALPVVPGEPMDVSIRLYATSVRIPARWRLRVALAGADADSFETGSSDLDRDLTLEYGGERPSSLVLPVVGEAV